MIKKIKSHSEFYKITKDNEVSPLLVFAISKLKNKGTVLDMGCGAGRDVKYLLKSGFEVTAVDINTEVEKYLESIPGRDKLKVVISAFEEFKFDKYDLISAQWSPPFVSTEDFDVVIQKVKRSLNGGGVFTGQLFGVNDEWNIPGKKMKFHTKEEVYRLFEGMEIIRIKEVERMGLLPGGVNKHWHLFHVVVRNVTDR